MIDANELGATLGFAPLEQAVRKKYAALRTVKKYELQKELQAIYLNLFETLSRTVLNDSLLGAFGLPADEDELSAHALPSISDFEGASTTFAWRDYAIDGVPPTADLVYSLPDLNSFIAVTLALGFHSDVAMPMLSLRVHDTAHARLKLDSQTKLPWLSEIFPPQNLRLAEIALLAGMSERSVRNATLANANDPLMTMSDQNRVQVSAKEALDWLSRRRGFVATRGEQ